MASEGIVGRAARCVANGTPIDWDAFSKLAPTAKERERLACLRLVQEISNLHRSDDRPESPMPIRRPTANEPVQKAKGSRRRAAVEKLRPLLSVGEVLKERYRVEHELGRGGQGVVFVGRDEALFGRRVVIKVPLASTEDNEWMAKKFRDEVRALARIDHPGVVGALDSGTTQGGQPFLVMQFVEGQTLRDAIPVTGLPLVRAADLLRQIGQALAAAHAKGVWHRDLKPDNIILLRLSEAREHVRLIDFGIASVRDLLGNDHRTRPFGSMPYMAPEQPEGRVHAASDIYSFGVLAYEMVTGRRPFAEQTLERQLSVQRTGRFPSPSRIRAELPRGASRLIIQALSFDADDRPADAAAFGEELANALVPRRTPTARAAGRTRSRRRRTRTIAILPLADISLGSQGEFFAAGLTEALMSTLGRITSLRVMGRVTAETILESRSSSAFVQKLNVDGFVEGAVSQHGSRMRIDIRLVDCATKVQLWGHSFDRDLADVLIVQGEVAESVAVAIGATLTSRDRRRLQGSVVNQQAHVACLRGYHHLQKQTSVPMATSRTWFLKAIDHDAGYAPAHAGLACWYATALINQVVSRDEALAAGTRAARIALASDPTLAAAHSAMGRMALLELDLPAAIRHTTRAIALDPADQWSRCRLGKYLALQGRFDEAVAHVERVVLADPCSAAAHQYAAEVHYIARRFEVALRYSDAAIELDPHHIVVHVYHGLIMGAAGNPDDATQALERATALLGTQQHPIVMAVSGYLLGISGRQEAAAGLLSRLALMQKSGKAAWSDLALVSVGLNDLDAVMDALERAVQDREVYVLGLRVDRIYDPLRPLDRFQALLARIRSLGARGNSPQAGHRP